MIQDLDATIAFLLKASAGSGSMLAEADVSFELPDGDWRAKLSKLTVNCYLYDIHENRQLRTQEPHLQRSDDGFRADRRQAPVRIDCAYAITGWSPALSESTVQEHALLSDVLGVLLRHRTIPISMLQGGLAGHAAPYPTVIAAADGVKNQPEFWTALNQQLKPSLHYVITLAVFVDELQPSGARVVDEGRVSVNGETVLVRS